jgi:hypothetical protein
MKISEYDKQQLKTLSILRKLPKNDSIHLCEASGLDQSHYNNHNKRAAGLLVAHYIMNGLSPLARAKVNSYFP